MVGDTASDGIPLLTRVLLVRATARFDPSFPSDGPLHSSSAPSPLSLQLGRSPTAYAPATGCAAPVHPSLRIVAHFAQNASNGTLRRATSTPKEEAEFFATQVSLSELLTALAQDRLTEKVRLRQLQTDIARTAVKLARATSSTSAVAAAAAGPASSPDAASFFSDSISKVPSLSAKGSRQISTHSTDVDEANLSSRSTNTNNNNNNATTNDAHVQGMLAAATASFAEDVAWRSLVTPYRPQLNPWCLTPVADDGCFVSVPTPAYAHWCELQAARCCGATATPTSASAAYTTTGSPASATAGGSTEPDMQGGPMRYNDPIHYSSVGGIGKSNDETGYQHGYVFLLDGAVFTGWGDQTEPAEAETPFSKDDGEVSVLLWCVLSDARVFTFMRTVTAEVVAAMSYVAQRTYHNSAGAAKAASSAPSRILGTGVPVDVYTAVLDAALNEEVVQPLAEELLVRGSTASRTLPGETFTVRLPLARGEKGLAGGGVAVRPQTSSMSGALTFRRPLDLLFPYADVPLATLLLSFGEDALRVLQSLLMQEERIVVIGATPQHASACVVSLLSLIAPLTWVSPLVPYLPPHTAAQTGLLYTLLSAPYELQQQSQNSTPYSSPVSPRPAPYASGGVASQSSQQMESAGFLLGSTAAIRPYLMFLAAYGVTESVGRSSRSGRAPRVWIADARTGAVGVCPTEPISQYLLADRGSCVEDGDSDRGSVHSHQSSPRQGSIHGSTTPSNNNNNGGGVGYDRSCTVHGGASAWTFPAHLDLRLAAPQFYNSLHGGSGSVGGGHGGSSARNPYVLYNAVRNTLRTAAELNVMDATPLDILPPFHDELRDALRRVAPAEKRRQFRNALEESAQHVRVRVESLESLAARLRRGLRQVLKAASTTATNSLGFSSFSVESDSDSSSRDSYSSSSGSDHSGSDSDDDDDDGTKSSHGGNNASVNTFRLDENASFRAVAEAVAPSHALTFPDPSTTNAVAQFPSLPASELWQVQSAILGYTVGRVAGAYRRGITTSSSRGGGTTHRLGSSERRRCIEASVFLAPGLDQHYTLAETVARTHLFRQFECAMLAVETVGLRRVLAGCGLRIGGVSEAGGKAGGGGECHAVMQHIRGLSLFAVLCDRARLQYPELYADLPGMDALGTVYATLVKRCFANRPGPPAPVSVPPPVRMIAGGGPSSDANRPSVISSSNSGTYSSGGSGGLRGFLSKAAKVMKLHGSSNNSNNTGSGAGGGGGRGLPVLYIPASVACMNSFAVTPFSAQHVAPQSFHITTYEMDRLVGSDPLDGDPSSSSPHRHHHHRRRRGLHLNRHTSKREAGGKHGRRRGKRLADLYAIPVPPQRQQWARQQQHQQRTALAIEFTLDDCTAVVRNHNVPGGVSGSLTSSFSASAAAAAVAAGGGGAGAVNFSNGSTYVSGVGMDAEVLTALARSGGARGGGGNDATMRVMAETSLSVCHALPLDVVHQFDAYEPLLAPLTTTSSLSSSTAAATTTTVNVGALLGGGAEEEERTGAAAYMRVGLFCPSCVNVWREGEARATRTLLQQQQQQQSRRRANQSPPLHPLVPPLPPKPMQMLGASSPQELQSWASPPPTPSNPARLLSDSSIGSTGSAAAANNTFTTTNTGAGMGGAGLPPLPDSVAASWGTFTSGAPLGYPVDSNSHNSPAMYNSHNNNPALLASSANWNPSASADLSTMMGSTSAPLLAAAASPTPPMPQTHAHQDVWDNWGVQAPVVVNTPNTVTVPTSSNGGGGGNGGGAAAAAAAAAGAGRRTGGASSSSSSSSALPNAATGNTATSMSVNGNSSNGNGMTGDGAEWMPTLALPTMATAPARVLPVTAPAPGDVMDELFAGLSNYNVGVSGSTTNNSGSNPNGAAPPPQPRRPTLEDFF